MLEIINTMRDVFDKIHEHIGKGILSVIIKLSIFIIIIIELFPIYNQLTFRSKIILPIYEFSLVGYTIVLNFNIKSNKNKIILLALFNLICLLGSLYFIIFSFYNDDDSSINVFNESKLLLFIIPCSCDVLLCIYLYYKIIIKDFESIMRIENHNKDFLRIDDYDMNNLVNDKSMTNTIESDLFIIWVVNIIGHNRKSNSIYSKQKVSDNMVEFTDYDNHFPTELDSKQQLLPKNMKGLNQIMRMNKLSEESLRKLLSQGEFQFNDFQVKIILTLWKKWSHNELEDINRLIRQLIGLFELHNNLMMLYKEGDDTITSWRSEIENKLKFINDRIKSL
jgi:hypothetical protein